MASSGTSFESSSARRSKAGFGGRLAIFVVVLVAAVVLFFEIRKRDETQTPAATPTTGPTAAPSPVATRTPSPIAIAERSTDWVVAKAPTATPTWWPTPEQRRHSSPSPTPSISRCVSFRWGAGQSLAAWGNVLIEIEVTNRCARPLDGNEIWFRVAGYRSDDLVQTARGHPFQTIFPGRSEIFSIGLPGSIDWYDRIIVEIVD